MPTRRRAVAWLVALNLVSVAICQVGVYEESDEEYEAPGVEDSSLSGYKTQTHDEASGTQYNFVEQAVQEQRSQSGSTGGKSLSELLAGGAEVEVIDLKDGTAPSGLRDIIQQMFSAAKPTKAKPSAPLPSVPPGTPLSQILQSILRFLQARLLRDGHHQIRLRGPGLLGDLVRAEQLLRASEWRSQALRQRL